MRKVVITGGPGCGKTSLVNYLEKLGYYTLPEVFQTANSEERMLLEKLYETDLLKFEERVFKMQINLENKIPPTQDLAFLDRGCGDIIAYLRVYGFSAPEWMIKLSKNRYDAIFVLDLIKSLKLTGRRGRKRKEVHKEIISTYKNLGYQPVRVPQMSIRDRAMFILKYVKDKIYL